MRFLLPAALVCLSLPSFDAQSSVRQVDFKNFVYPLSGSLLGHTELKWLNLPSGGGGSRVRTVQLKDGRSFKKDLSFRQSGREYAQYEGFVLQSVTYADVTDEGKEDAIVVLRYLTGGTQATHYVYIYAFEAGKPKLLAYCRTGDRAYHGLYRIYGERGNLVFELLDPGKSEGDCCSSGFVRTRYRWDGNRFQAVGRPEYGSVKEP
jgi:hypothetical protein